MTEPAPRGWRPGPRDAITDVPGIRVGHWTDRRAGTGCTVILCPGARAAAVDVRGGAPGTRETDVLSPANTVRTCHAVLLAGGSAFGLAAADGVMRWLSEREIGFETRFRKVPIVPGAVIFDLGVGRDTGYPGAEAGYAAATRATGGAVAQGTVGAGTGATVAKLLGADARLKGGIGTASLHGPRNILVGAIAVVNALGLIVDPDTGDLVAAPVLADGEVIPLPEAVIRAAEAASAAPGENTTLVCVATNAALEHRELQRLAVQAHDGLARAILPVHTFADGDVAFTLSTGSEEVLTGESLLLGLLATRTVELAVLHAIREARPLAGVRAARDIAALRRPGTAGSRGSPDPLNGLRRSPVRRNR